MTQSDWIKVEERLPDSGEFVIVNENLGTCGSYCFAYLVNENFGKHSWKNINGIDDLTNITHWMPLPLPPGVAHD